MPRTELVWDGKYDAQGRRVVPFKVPLPFQTVETVNEPAGERKTLWSMMEAEKPWRNRLVWGDKKYVLPSLLAEFAAVTTDDVNHIIETKGQEDIHVKFKDRAAILWCENATRLTGKAWCYTIVREQEFDKLNADLFSDLDAIREGGAGAGEVQFE